MIYERALNETNYLNSTIQTLQEQLATYPPEKLIYSKKGKYINYYASDGKNKIYIPTKDRAYAEILAQKKYIETQINNYKHELNAINTYIQMHNNEKSNSADNLLIAPEYVHLLSTHFQPKSHILTEWMNSNYEHKEDYSEQLIHIGRFGKKYRSKSELFISNALSDNNIPFRYECKLELGKHIYYPDFTIKHPETLDIYYWEHFGMMDNPEYIRHTLDKLKIYIKNGIIPTINLIVTFETQKNPLNLPYVDTLIQHYFL